jgi:hypothetical protein
MRKKAPPYAKRMRIPKDNKTVYVFVDWLSWQQANQITQARGMILLPDDDPRDYLWPVRDCGVIIMDYVSAAPQVINALTTELKQQGAIEVHHVDFAETSIDKHI